MMKKLLLTLTFVSALTTVSAQTATDSEKSSETAYNKWSVELGAGVNKPQRIFTPGYYSSTPSPYTLDLGVRYMLNNKFGIKADVGYNSFENKNSSADFKSQYYRVDLQGVANLGRIMGFETFSSRIGLLGHAGFGYGQMKFDANDKTDQVGNFIVGITGQIKLSDRIALTGDFTSMTNFAQDLTFDGNTRIGHDGFRGGVFNGTIGIAVYLGKNAKHADWVMLDSKDKEEIEALKKKVADIETLMNDSDKDGVPDYLDAEPNSTAGVAVDTKGRAIDRNGNGVPDELENYLDKRINSIKPNPSPSNNELVRNLINAGYVTTYFDFNKSTPTNVSTEGIDFILTYLRNNPTESVDIIGHADEIGRNAYNDKLSNNRANAVKNILLKAKIDASRLNVVPAGEDNSVDKDSAGARKLVRRVTFKVK